MRRISQVQVLVGIALALALAVTIACSSSGSGGEDAATPTPTGTPFFSATNIIPTPATEQPGPTVENLPAPTPEGEPTVTASGLQIYELKVGDGAEAQSGGIAYINYTIWAKGGNEVDRTRIGPVRYRLATGYLIDGLLEGVIGMKVGGERLLVIPPHLAYGSAGSGNVIPPNATLIYHVQLTGTSNPSR